MTVSRKSSSSMPDHPLRFGVFTDLHHLNKRLARQEWHLSSLSKLKHIVNVFNSRQLDFVIQLGDLTESGPECLGETCQVLAELRHPMYHVLGNHDLDGPHDTVHRVLQQLGLREFRYSFSPRPNWRCIVLDGNEISLFKYPENSKRHREAQALFTELKASGRPNAFDYNGGLGQEQLRWLRRELIASRESHERVAIFCHYPCFPNDGAYTLWDCEELTQLLSCFDVTLYVSGHQHTGLQGSEHGLKYLNLPSVFGPPAENSFAILTLSHQQIDIEGYGLVSSGTLR